MLVKLLSILIIIIFIALVVKKIVKVILGKKFKDYTDEEKGNVRKYLHEYNYKGQIFSYYMFHNGTTNTLSTSNIVNKNWRDLSDELKKNVDMEHPYCVETKKLISQEMRQKIAQMNHKDIMKEYERLYNKK